MITVTWTTSDDQTFTKYPWQSTQNVQSPMEKQIHAIKIAAAHPVQPEKSATLEGMRPVPCVKAPCFRGLYFCCMLSYYETNLLFWHNKTQIPVPQNPRAEAIQNVYMAGMCQTRTDSALPSLWTSPHEVWEIKAIPGAAESQSC